jgi:hypothetical protein
LGVKILKFFDADPRSGMETIRILDPEWKKSDPGSGINIRDPQHWSHFQYIFVKKLLNRIVAIPGTSACLPILNRIPIRKKMSFPSN